MIELKKTIYISKDWIQQIKKQKKIRKGIRLDQGSRLNKYFETKFKACLLKFIFIVFIKNELYNIYIYIVYSVNRFVYL
jgi:hypothetical protein